jgi:hypothetical protein
MQPTKRAKLAELEVLRPAKEELIKLGQDLSTCLQTASGSKLERAVRNLWLRHVTVHGLAKAWAMMAATLREAQLCAAQCMLSRGHLKQAKILQDVAFSTPRYDGAARMVTLPEACRGLDAMQLWDAAVRCMVLEPTIVDPFEGDDSKAVHRQALWRSIAKSATTQKRRFDTLETCWAYYFAHKV